jgi:glycosyltransferase involved in cell wall biosynthesis
MIKINTKDPLITIILLSFNHEKYIEKALDSILAQKTTIDCKIIVVDDFSNDKTRQIINNYKEKYPFIELNYNTENIGASLSLYNIYSKTRTKYITVLEGDDYWLTNHRIESLVNFLEQNTQYIGVSHKRSHIDLFDNVIGNDPEKDLINKPFKLNDFIQGKRFSIAGSLYRNIYYKLKNFKEMFTITKNVADFQTVALLLNYGNFFIFNEEFSVYLKRSKLGESNYNSVSTYLDVGASG